MSSLFQKKGLQPWLFSSPKRCARPFGHFTVKQKCLIHSADVLALETVKLRPLIAHDKHPARLGLKRIARALALLVETVIPFVKEKRPQHTPMWRLHAGTLSLLLALQRSISSGVRIESLVELDVADCFFKHSAAGLSGACLLAGAYFETISFCVLLHLKRLEKCRLHWPVRIASFLVLLWRRAARIR